MLARSQGGPETASRIAVLHLGQEVVGVGTSSPGVVGS